MFAADALAWVGRDGVAPLVAALEVKGQSPTRRSEIIRAIGIVQYRGPELRQTIPILISSLQDSDEFVAGLAASALGAFVIEPEKCIPALTKAAESPAYRVRRNAIRSLGEFGPQAGGASNVIANGLNDSEANVRKEATNALRKIAPEGLGTNGVDHW
jgi:HEAT repeat protein